ncbi:FecR domain-containing protein [Microbulbifer spongiae]|uniref:DUF4880 domain-containing protein n=1 Tax=Microbulbifer spongiae TaxID=2944933 RepID=A0ABY9ECG3_9GAMM|nr:FecR domain-containing protein [Microbulbifer sp. MI-G]WKD50155.1 DUF4880 domain-containing protein [Microbulbifer sp. MI-G]
MTSVTESESAPFPDAIVGEAIRWRIRLASGEVQESEQIAWRAWRAANPEHERIWQRLEAMESAFHKLNREAPGLASATLIKTDKDMRKIRRRRMLKAVGGTTLGMLAAGWIGHHRGVFHHLKADYSAQGQPRHYTLQDNSQLWLNSGSAIELDFSGARRRIRLSSGEIHLAGAPDPRPLHVSVADSLFTARDSRFFVRDGGHYALLQVVQGQVEMRPRHGASPMQANAGEAFRITHTDVQVLDSRMFDYSGWVDGVLSVRSMPLGEFLQELSRYFRGFLRCDPRLETQRISGVFQLQQLDLTLKTLARSVGGEVRYLTPWWATIQ